MRQASSHKRKVLSISPNKRGIVLPIVMIFMVISQVVYWGIIHLNQINSQQYIQFQAYYQAQIQNNMVDHLMNNDDAVFAEELEKQVSNQLLTQHELMINSLGIDTWWLEEAQVGIASLATNTEIERILLFQQFVFIDQQQLDFCLLFNSIDCSGRLNTNGTYDPLIFDKLNPSADTFSSLQRQFVAEGFSLNRQLKRNFLDVWTYSGLVDALFTFNLGHVAIQRVNSNDYQYTTQLKQIAFMLKQTHPIESADYLLIWQGYIYERPVIYIP